MPGPENPDRTSTAAERAPAEPRDGRAPWRAPELTRLPISRTLLGGTVGNEGNGAFAFDGDGG